MILFWGYKPIDKIGKNCFCQWFPSTFVADGITYSCAEQYMMAQKAKLFGDKESFDKIIASTNPKEMQQFGREVKNFDQNIWNENKFSIVRTGNLYKFSQNKEMKEFLLSTKDELIAEASPYDCVWGIGYKEDNPLSKDISQWRGENLLGKAIMDVRKELSINIETPEEYIKNHACGEEADFIGV